MTRSVVVTHGRGLSPPEEAEQLPNLPAACDSYRLADTLGHVINPTEFICWTT